MITRARIQMPQKLSKITPQNKKIKITCDDHDNTCNET